MPEIATLDQSVYNKEEELLVLYQKAFPIVAKYISKMGGDFDTAKDVFHDAVIIYYENYMFKHQSIRVNETACLVGIAKNLWKKQFKGSYKEMSLDVSFDKLNESFFDVEEALPSKRRLMNFLEKAGSKCMELLQAFYYEQLPLTQIASHFGFSGVRSATVQKYKCLQKVKNKVKEKSLIYDDFLN
ncbi:RNA polymerase sigma factor [Chondrinema litorale]|uniref:RNA polymerase sigma factor n=1 Tax=Chondrinema litorale TaxID=2994555 RepID=UPI0025434687|nr:sigma-70 family RNA polymerase sigma factor [Chondrinema litorale]UZR99376.1 sigma-70 family RNA polymerase sigma factor [Chondrinema litorale]